MYEYQLAAAQLTVLQCMNMHTGLPKVEISESSVTIITLFENHNSITA